MSICVARNADLWYEMHIIILFYHKTNLSASGAVNNFIIFSKSEFGNECRGT